MATKKKAAHVEDAPAAASAPAKRGKKAAPKEGFDHATLVSTYEHEGESYGPGRDIEVPQNIADMHNVDLPINQGDEHVMFRAEYKAEHDGEDIPGAQDESPEAKQAALARAREPEQTKGGKR